ncbi:hypothetical protein OUZ56_028715 [Daphnia magna]|uniref:RING-type domain-containing protein n=1 Tax=Daphnia magna TaxID=35525 RepID=A0ABR0B4P5_9CRUS|nr:hypothetical protein OUZ56_028715 [Daphnia magna]
MDTQPVMLREEVQMEEPARKRFCPDYLAAEFSGSSCNADVDVNDEENDKESVYSWQSYETAWAADSGDDWSFSEVDEDSLTEYEIVDENSTVLESQCSDSSSSTEVPNIHFPEGLLPSHLTESSSSFSDESGWDDPNGETSSYFDDGSQSQTSWKCLECRAPTSAPRNFCFTCYQKRKSSRPPRPVRRSKKPGRTKTSGSSHTDDCEMVISPGISSDNVCTVCHVEVRNGAFVHRKTAHVAACYACTLKISKKPNAKCPICRQSIQNTIKIFFN